MKLNNPHLLKNKMITVIFSEYTQHLVLSLAQKQSIHEHIWLGAQF